MTAKCQGLSIINSQRAKWGKGVRLWFQTRENGNTEQDTAEKLRLCCFQRFSQSNLKLLSYTSQVKFSSLWQQQSLVPAERTWCLYLVSLWGSDFISQKKNESIFYILGYKSDGKSLHRMLLNFKHHLPWINIFN